MVILDPLYQIDGLNSKDFFLIWTTMLRKSTQNEKCARLVGN